MTRAFRTAATTWSEHQGLIYEIAETQGRKLDPRYYNASQLALIPQNCFDSSAGKRLLSGKKGEFN